MRLLACFAKNRIVLEEPGFSREDHHDPRLQRPVPVPDPTIFVPTTVAELHPEYAHSEPYCFAAKTESARVIVERAREKRGTAVDPSTLPELPELGKQIIVHGPSYNRAAAQAKENSAGNANKSSDDSAFNSASNVLEKRIAEDLLMHSKTPEALPKSPSKPVRLQVEMPSTVDESYADSDDLVLSENVAEGNMPLADETEHSVNSKTAVSSHHHPSKKEKSRMKRSNKSLRSIKSRKSKSDSVGTKRETSRKRSDSHSTLPTAWNSETDRKLSQAELNRRMENTPKELLAPIRVPRLSSEYNIRSSPALSSDSWAPNNSSERYEDVEGDGSHNFLALENLDIVGKQKVVHKASTPPSETREIPTIEDGDAYYEASDVPLGPQGVRSKRKSMAFSAHQHESGSSDSTEGELPSADLNEVKQHAMQRLQQARSQAVEMPPATALSAPGIEVSMEREDIGTPTTDEELFPLPSAATKLAALQRVQHDAPLDLPLAEPFNSTGMVRRMSNNKRKTVSFRDESPVIIEPNLTARVPSKSVPRNVMLSRENNAERQPLPSALRAPPPRSPIRSHVSTPDMQASPRREWSDSSSLASDDIFSARMSRRASRVSIKDKEAVREASRRQSQAVAKAMAEQIRGIPKSAMLAYSENEVLYSEDDDELFGYNGELNLEPSIRRRARSTKSIRLPPVAQDGVVPPPPPPPPFAPQKPRVMSVRDPPPPPSSPIQRG